MDRVNTRISSRDAHLSHGWQCEVVVRLGVRMILSYINPRRYRASSMEVFTLGAANRRTQTTCDDQQLSTFSRLNKLDTYFIHSLFFPTFLYSIYKITPSAYTFQLDKQQTFIWTVTARRDHRLMGM